MAEIRSGQVQWETALFDVATALGLQVESKENGEVRTKSVTISTPAGHTVDLFFKEQISREGASGG